MRTESLPSRNRRHRIFDACVLPWLRDKKNCRAEEWYSTDAGDPARTSCNFLQCQTSPSASPFSEWFPINPQQHKSNRGRRLVDIRNWLDVSCSANWQLTKGLELLLAKRHSHRHRFSGCAAPPSRLTPISTGKYVALRPTDQKVGGSNPSERATWPRPRLADRGGPASRRTTYENPRTGGMSLEGLNGGVIAGPCKSECPSCEVLGTPPR